LEKSVDDEPELAGKEGAGSDKEASEKEKEETKKEILNSDVAGTDVDAAVTVTDAAEVQDEFSPGGGVHETSYWQESQSTSCASLGASHTGRNI